MGLTKWPQRRISLGLGQTSQCTRRRVRGHFPVLLDCRRHALLAPLPQHLFYSARDLLTCVSAVYTACQQLIVRGVVVANCGGNRQGQSLFIKISTCLRTANAAAAPDSGMFGNGCNFSRRTAWE